MIRFLLCITVLLCWGLPLLAQDSLPARKLKPSYYRKEEIIYDGKRYRLHNNYVTLGAGPAISTIRSAPQRVAVADFNFHIRKQYFQAGVMLSGYQFFSNTHLQAHVGYGIRREGGLYHFALFAGPSYYQGVEGSVGQPPHFYEGVGIHVDLQTVAKLTYDIGAGFEFFADFGFADGAGGREQVMYGVKAIVFFSGAYRGIKRNYNPNVRAENPYE